MSDCFDHEIVDEAIRDLRRRGLPTEELEAVRGSVDLMDARNPDDCPYFIPNNIELCGPNTILNCSHIDEELEIPAGFSIEATATRARTFAKPYYIDPINGKRRCQGLFALESYDDRISWKYDLSFIGFRGHVPVQPDDFGDSTFCRAIFLDRFARDFSARNRHWRIRFQINETFFFRDPTVSQESLAQANHESGYIESIADSRFVLCPRGVGRNSIRFFETLARCNVPVYIGDQDTKFPLDWLIDWGLVCFRIPFEDVLEGKFEDRLSEILATPIEDTNARRRYIFRIYHQFLAPDRKAVFEQLVLLKAKHLLERSQAAASLPVELFAGSL